MTEEKLWRYVIPRLETELERKTTKFSLVEKAGYVHYGQLGFGEYNTQDDYWTPQIISQILYQAKTGKIPVSGAGYGGSFSGDGFDGIWFDMSEIVRPTRDGIHGREYISTKIELGRKEDYINFKDTSGLLNNGNSLLEVPIPIIFNPLPLPKERRNARKALFKSAKILNNYAIVSQDNLSMEYENYKNNIIPRLKKHPDQLQKQFIKQAKVVELESIRLYNEIKNIAPKSLISLYLPVKSGIKSRIIEIIDNYDLDIIHLHFNIYGKSELGNIVDVIRSIHEILNEHKIRNKISLLVSGGIAAADHIPKAMICGADCVAIDYSLLIALGCSLWADLSYPCPVEHEEIDINWGSQRILNLMAAWRDQILEVLGAMGIREVRRIRGEIGRAIFYNEEIKIFKDLFEKKSKSSDFGYISPSNELSFGDCRWPHWLIRSTIDQARTGEIPTELEYRMGKSAGGFDRLRFVFENQDIILKDDTSIDLSLKLNKRRFGPYVEIPQPVYSGGMSFGSISLNVMEARAKAAVQLGSFMSTGEGGYPDRMLPYKNHIITQVATGLFGVSEDTIQRAPIVEFKYAQGAKPGLGGHLLAGKVTEAVASAREAVAGHSLYSPFPFHSVYSVEDHKKHIDWIRQMNPEALVIVKVSTPRDVDMVSVGSYYAGANIVNIDGSYGGTGAAPEVSKKNIAMPVEYAIPKVHKFLSNEGIRDEMTLIASGGIRTGYDIAKAVALGADGAMVGTADLVALGCERLGVCEKGDGCPAGLTTTDPKYASLVDPEWGRSRIVNLRNAWAIQLRQILKALGMKKISELRGRTDKLIYLEEEQK
jgi:glutamate synthase domain-containing protein 2